MGFFFPKRPQKGKTPQKGGGRGNFGDAKFARGNMFSSRGAAQGKLLGLWVELVEIPLDDSEEVLLIFFEPVPFLGHVWPPANWKKLAQLFSDPGKKELEALLGLGPFLLGQPPKKKGKS